MRDFKKLKVWNRSHKAFVKTNEEDWNTFSTELIEIKRMLVSLAKTVRASHP